MVLISSKTLKNGANELGAFISDLFEWFPVNIARASTLELFRIEPEPMVGATIELQRAKPGNVHRPLTESALSSQLVAISNSELRDTRCTFRGLEQYGKSPFFNPNPRTPLTSQERDARDLPMGHLPDARDAWGVCRAKRHRPHDTPACARSFGQHHELGPYGRGTEPRYRWHRKRTR